LLAEKAGQVIAVELDPHMVNLLKNEYSHLPNLTIVEADILQTNLDSLINAAQDAKELSIINNQWSIVNDQPLTPNPPPPTYKVVANLPYYITSAVIRHVLEAPLRPERVVVTVQKE